MRGWYANAYWYTIKGKYKILFFCFVLLFFSPFFDPPLIDAFLKWNYSSIFLASPHYFEQKAVVPMEYVIKLESTVLMKGFTNNNSGLLICIDASWQHFEYQIIQASWKICLYHFQWKIFILSMFDLFLFTLVICNFLLIKCLQT